MQYVSVDEKLIDDFSLYIMCAGAAGSPETILSQ